jgi:hypothetical protein
MTSIYKENKHAINNQALKLLKVMKQMDMRRYKTYLFSMYNNTKIYTPIREFVWTHIKIPFLAESTVDAFMNLLEKKECEDLVTIKLTDNCLNPSDTYEIECLLGHSLLDVVETVEEFSEPLDDIDPVNFIRYKHPDDKKVKVVKEKDFLYTLGDLGFTDGSIIQMYPAENSK